MNSFVFRMLIRITGAKAREYPLYSKWDNGNLIPKSGNAEQIAHSDAY